MAYLRQEDVEVIIYGEELDVLKQAIDEHFDRAEASTVDFFKGYLRTRYDVDALFADWDGTGSDPRPPALVTNMADHLLCILYATQPDRMIPENRLARCEAVEKWLENINSGKLDPGFPVPEDEDGNEMNAPVKWGGNTKVSGMW